MNALTSFPAEFFALIVFMISAAAVGLAVLFAYSAHLDRKATAANAERDAANSRPSPFSTVGTLPALTPEQAERAAADRAEFVARREAAHRDQIIRDTIARRNTSDNGIDFDYSAI